MWMPFADVDVNRSWVRATSRWVSTALFSGSRGQTGSEVRKSDGVAGQRGSGVRGVRQAQGGSDGVDASEALWRVDGVNSVDGA